MNEQLDPWIFLNYICEEINKRVIKTVKKKVHFLKYNSYVMYSLFLKTSNKIYFLYKYDCVIYILPYTKKDNNVKILFIFVFKLCTCKEIISIKKQDKCNN